jgi:hypothetical protein
MAILTRSKTSSWPSKLGALTFDSMDLASNSTLSKATVRELLYSSDSVAWSFAGRKSGSEHDPRIALAYAAKIEALIGQPSFIQPQLFHWWNETEHKVR